MTRETDHACIERVVTRLEAARELQGRTAEVVAHGHRAVIELQRDGTAEVRVYRCGCEIEGVICYRSGLAGAATARVVALELCAAEAQRTSQLDLFWRSP